VDGRTQWAGAQIEAAQTDARRTTEPLAAVQTFAAARAAASELAARAVAALGGRSERNGDAAADTGTGARAAEIAAAAWANAQPEAASFVDAFAARPSVWSGGVEAVERADVAGRLDRVQALQDLKSAHPLSQVMLRVDAGDGTEAKINVGLRGNTVGATIDMADPMAAASMRAHVAELRQALERQGLDTSSLLVRAAARLPDGSDAGRHAAALTSADLLASLANAAGRESAGQRDHTAQNQHTATRRDPDAQRQRQNRNDKEDRP
jgi:hypothetical protein